MSGEPETADLLSLDGTPTSAEPKKSIEIIDIEEDYDPGVEQTEELRDH